MTHLIDLPAEWRERGTYYFGAPYTVCAKALESAIREDVLPLVEALKYVRQRIENSDQWWMDSEDKGGFDTDLIDAALAKFPKETKE